MESGEMTVSCGLSDYNERVVIILTKNDCPKIFFVLETNLRYPKWSTNQAYVPSVECVNQDGILIVYFNEKDKKIPALRISYSFLSTIVKNSKSIFESIPAGLDFYCQINLSDVNKSISGSLEGTVAGNGSFGSTFNGVSKGAILSNWMSFRNSEIKPSEEIENSAIQQLAEAIKKTSQHVIEDHNRRLANIQARANYVHTEKDEKIFLFWFKHPEKCYLNLNYESIAISENGFIWMSGVGQDDDKENRMKIMEKSLYESHWECNVIRAEKGNPELIAALKKLSKEDSDKNRLIAAAS